MILAIIFSKTIHFGHKQARKTIWQPWSIATPSHLQSPLRIIHEMFTTRVLSPKNCSITGFSVEKKRIWKCRRSEYESSTALYFKDCSMRKCVELNAKHWSGGMYTSTDITSDVTSINCCSALCNQWFWYWVNTVNLLSTTRFESVTVQCDCILLEVLQLGCEKA